ncbi:hypothetical protein S245_037046, partial [Arachis hypogaea]
RRSSLARQRHLWRPEHSSGCSSACHHPQRRGQMVADTTLLLLTRSDLPLSSGDAGGFLSCQSTLRVLFPPVPFPRRVIFPSSGKTTPPPSLRREFSLSFTHHARRRLQPLSEQRRRRGVKQRPLLLFVAALS